jgi:CBS domain-containing protein
MKLKDVPWDPAVICDSETWVAEAARQMDKHGVDGVIITQGRNQPVACFGRDHLQSPPVPPGVRWQDWPIGPAASVCTFALTPETTVERALQIMRRRHLPVAPVAHNGEIAGVVRRRRLEAWLDRKEGEQRPTLRAVARDPSTLAGEQFEEQAELLAA